MTATRQLLCWAFLICCRASDTGPLPGSSDGVPPKSEGEGGPPRPISPGSDGSDDIVAPPRPESSFERSDGSDRIPVPPRRESSFPRPHIPMKQPKDSGFQDFEPDASHSSFFDEPPYSQHLTDRYNTQYNFEDSPNPNLHFLPRFREVHIGADLDLMPGGKLYRSAKPIDLPDIVDPNCVIEVQLA
eukprot:GEMP01108361.1.p1 GENE.GEMP01108361.1~~GEMP01108361.1.p1  ORF type:complete len:211 (+),score=32.22 GEMP01108361.1:73-633(+)